MDLSYETVSNQGERVVAGDREGLLKEHEDRYQYALDFIPAGALVLDCACGTGYGAPVLAKRAGKVIGVDISPVAIKYAKSHYADAKIEFCEGSAEALDLPANSVDVFISFETIEHISHPEKLISEAKRVLKPSGIFLVSTPNRVVSGLRSGERPSNPFHLREWSLGEFDAVLKTEFSNIAYFGQRIKSSNKFTPPYMLSKWKRFTGSIDIIPLRVGERTLVKMDSPRFWQPMIFIASCRS